MTAPLGLRAYLHRRAASQRFMLAIGQTIAGDRLNRRALSYTRRALRAYRVTPLIHNGKKARK